MKLRELIWIVLLIGVTLYFTLGKEKQTDFGFDEKAYQRKIDSLISISSNNDKIIDSLKNDNKIRQEKIVGLKGDLTNLNKNSSLYKHNSWDGNKHPPVCMNLKSKSMFN